MSRASTTMLLSSLPLLFLLALLNDVATLVVADDVDYYEILEVPEREDATERDIKSNFRRLSKLNHPDLHGEATRERYQKIQRAYEVLSDRRKRKVYDMKGEEGLKQLETGKNQQNMPMDPFQMLFGGGGGQQQSNRGANNHMMMVVNLADVYNGASHTVKFMKQRLCKKCRGTGANSKDDYKECGTCGGRGVTIQRIQIMPGFVQEAQAPCQKCGGKGKVVKAKCTTCKGKKVQQVESTLSIDIEVGTPENHDLVFEMEADQTPEQIPGDVIFTMNTAPHPVFTRRSQHLEMTMKLTLKEALLGFSRSFRHLDDRDVEVDEDGVVQFGQKRVLKGEGMPAHNVPSEKGDLTITYAVEFPTALTSEQQREIAAILPA